MPSLGTAIANPHSLATEAYFKIRDKILKGEIGLGQPVSRRNLAEEFGMSFVPVAEAIQRLESEGMLETLPRVGTRVRIPTANDVRDRYIVREALEVQCARLFCEKATAAEREELTRMAQRLDKMAQQLGQVSEAGQAISEEQLEFQMYHVRFHMRIAECAGCVPLYEILEKNQVLIFNWLCDISTDSHMPAKWHGDLIAVVRGNDPDAAALAMGKHIRTGMSEIQSTIALRFGANISWMHKRSAGRAGGEAPAVVGWRKRRTPVKTRTARS
jgi:DNA-binding GntR family transcriptional regulator